MAWDLGSAEARHRQIVTAGPASDVGARPFPCCLLGLLGPLSCRFFGCTHSAEAQHGKSCRRKGRSARAALAREKPAQMEADVPKDFLRDFDRQDVLRAVRLHRRSRTAGAGTPTPKGDALITPWRGCIQEHLQGVRPPVSKAI